MSLRLFLTMLSLLYTFALLPNAQAAEPLAEVALQPDGLVLQPRGSAAGYTLTVSLPSGTVIRREFDGDAVPAFRLGDLGGEVADGTYTYQLIATPLPPQANGSTRRFSGYFKVSGGALILGGIEKPTAKPTAPTVGGLQNLPTGHRVNDWDVIIDGNLCAGEGGCVSGENFGDDVFRVKDDDPRVHFEDTSTGTFPANDWRLVINDSDSGGGDYFAIEDAETGDQLFRLEAGAAADSFVMDDMGRVGLGTATPAADLHILRDATATLRLEDSNGTTAQIWEVGGNKDEFFVKDASGTATRPLRIEVEAPDNSLYVSADGKVALGSTSPNYHFHIDVDEDANVIGLVETVNTGTSAASVWQTRSDTAILSHTSHGSGRPLSRFGEVLGSWNEVLASSGEGLIVGTLFADPLILGTNNNNVLEIASDGEIFHRGVSLHADYVFEEDYDLPTIEENAEFIRIQKHLMAIGPRRVAEDGREVVELGSDRRGIVEELEKAHLYIIQLHEELERLRRRLDTP